MDAPEIHGPHRHGGGNRLDMIVGLAALVTSVVSITVAVRHGDTMEKLVEAQSWPHIELDSSNLVDDQPNIALRLRSTGSGPARINTLSISYDGQPVENWPALIRACCISDPKADDATLLRETDGRAVTGSPVGAVLLPADKALIFSLPRSAANLTLWRRLDQNRSKLRFSICYCSVFDECYASELRRSDPKHVASCPVRNDQWQS